MTPKFFPSKLRIRLRNSTLLRFLLLFACGAAFVQIIAYFQSVIVVFTSAAILAVMLNYPVQWLSRWMPRKWAVGIVFLVSIFMLIALAITVGLEVVTQGQSLVTQLTDFLRERSTEPLSINGLILQNLERILQAIQTGLVSGILLVQSLFSNIINFIFVGVICIYMLLDGDQVWSLFLGVVPAEIRGKFSLAVERNFLGFFRAQLILMILLIIPTFLIYFVLRINYSLILSLVLGILNIIPVVGASIGIFIVTLLVFSSQGLETAVKVLVASLILKQIHDNIIYPKILKDSLNINPVILFFAIFVGQAVAGLLGAFLAIPIAGLIVGWSKDEPIERLTEGGEG